MIYRLKEDFELKDWDELFIAVQDEYEYKRGGNNLFDHMSGFTVDKDAIMEEVSLVDIMEGYLNLKTVLDSITDYLRKTLDDDSIPHIIEVEDSRDRIYGDMIDDLLDSNAKIPQSTKDAIQGRIEDLLGYPTMYKALYDIYQNHINTKIQTTKTIPLLKQLNRIVKIFKEKQDADTQKMKYELSALKKKQSILRKNKEALVSSLNTEKDLGFKNSESKVSDELISKAEEDINAKINSVLDEIEYIEDEIETRKKESEKELKQNLDKQIKDIAILSSLIETVDKEEKAKFIKLYEENEEDAETAVKGTQVEKMVKQAKVMCGIVISTNKLIDLNFYEFGMLKSGYDNLIEFAGNAKKAVLTKADQEKHKHKLKIHIKYGEKQKKYIEKVQQTLESYNKIIEEIEQSEDTTKLDKKVKASLAKAKEKSVDLEEKLKAAQAFYRSSLKNIREQLSYLGEIKGLDDPAHILGFDKDKELERKTIIESILGKNKTAQKTDDLLNDSNEYLTRGPD